jgi:hypothetical protein
MISGLLFLLLALIALVAIGTLLAYIWIKDPFKTALGSCLSSLAVLVGSLGVPDVKGTANLSVNFGIGTLNSTGVAFSTGTPPVLWGIAFVSIVILVALFAVLVFLRDRARATPAKPAGGARADGGLGGEVF